VRGRSEVRPSCSLDACDGWGIGRWGFRGSTGIGRVICCAREKGLHWPSCHLNQLSPGGLLVAQPTLQWMAGQSSGACVCGCVDRGGCRCGAASRAWFWRPTPPTQPSAQCSVHGATAASFQREVFLRAGGWHPLCQVSRGSPPPTTVHPCAPAPPTHKTQETIQAALRRGGAVSTLLPFQA
jgi:hypothetical protein